ncbi:MAG: hypothetical protein WBC04_24955 [Candidatus Acidiferrales bacterium]
MKKIAAFAVGLTLFLLMLTPVVGNFNSFSVNGTSIRADGTQPPPPINPPPHQSD